jgi:hypothetical protein
MEKPLSISQVKLLIETIMVGFTAYAWLFLKETYTLRKGIRC